MIHTQLPRRLMWLNCQALPLMGSVIKAGWEEGQSHREVDTLMSTYSRHVASENFLFNYLKNNP